MIFGEPEAKPAIWPVFIFHNGQHPEYINELAGEPTYLRNGQNLGIACLHCLNFKLSLIIY